MPTPQASKLRLLTQKIQGRLHHPRDLPARLSRPNLPATRESAALFLECFHTVSVDAGLDGSIARATDIEALYGSFDAFLAFRAGEIEVATSSLIEAWTSASFAELFGLDAEEVTAQAVSFASSLRRDLGTAQADLVADASARVARTLADLAERSEWLVLFHQAVEQVGTAELGTQQARTALRSLMARLDLSQDDLGRLFGVSGETIRRWERGMSSIPAERRTGLFAAESALRRLQDLFRPNRLPSVIRRRVELFDRESALDWILRGRIAEVADRYEEALLYQA